MAKKVDVVRKLKENATKYVQKGDYEKALDQYKQLSRVEPGDLRFRMKVGECLAKLNRKKDAIDEYNKIVEEYTKEGFLIQAIAICKLILQLDPTETASQNRLADLNSRRGIVVGDRKPQIRPALSLQGVSNVPSAVKPEAAAPAAAPEPAVAPLEEIEEPSEVAAASEEAAPELPPLQGETEEKVSDEEAAPELAPEEELAPSMEGPPSVPEPKPELHDGTPERPIPLEEAPPEAEEEPVKAAAPGATPFPDIPLFSDLNAQEFTRVVGKFQIGTLPKGITVIKEGSRGDSFFILAGGKVRVYKWSANQKHKKTLATLQEGSFFGEFAFLTNSARTASVETLEECVLLRINRKDLEEIIKEFPHVQQVINEFYKKRVLDTLLMISPLFESLSEDDRREVIRHFENVELDTGDVIIREGEEGKAFYLIKHGSIDVTKKDPKSGEVIRLATLKEGDFFGEISLLQNKPTTATCTANIPTSMFRLPKTAFNELIMTHPQILETVSAAVDERLKSTTKNLTARQEDRQSEGLV